MKNGMRSETIFFVISILFFVISILFFCSFLYVAIMMQAEQKREKCMWLMPAALFSCYLSFFFHFFSLILSLFFHFFLSFFPFSFIFLSHSFQYTLYFPSRRPHGYWDTEKFVTLNQKRERESEFLH